MPCRKKVRQCKHEHSQSKSEHIQLVVNEVAAVHEVRRKRANQASTTQHKTKNLVLICQLYSILTMVMAPTTTPPTATAATNAPLATLLS